MKTIIVILLILSSQNIFAKQGFVDTKSLMKFEGYNIDTKTIILSGKVFSYEMLDFEDSYFDTDDMPKDLKTLRKGQKLYITLRKDNLVIKEDNKLLQMPEKVITASFNEDAL